MAGNAYLPESMRLQGADAPLSDLTLKSERVILPSRNIFVILVGCSFVKLGSPGFSVNVERQYEMIVWTWGLVGAGLGGTAWRFLGPRHSDARRRAHPGVRTFAMAMCCGLAFGVYAARDESLLLLLALSCFMVHAIVLAGLDIAVRRLPNLILLSGYACTGLPLTANAAVTGEVGPLLRAAEAAVAALALFGALYVAAAGQLGGGDVKLAGLLGLALGWFGWGTAIMGLWVGLATASGGALLLRARSKERTCPGLPLGSYLIIGALAVIIMSAG